MLIIESSMFSPIKCIFMSKYMSLKLSVDVIAVPVLWHQFISVPSSVEAAAGLPTEEQNGHWLKGSGLHL